MTNEEKIVQLLEILHGDVQGLKEGQQEQGKKLDVQGEKLATVQTDVSVVKTTVSQLKTAVETLDAGQQAHRAEMNMRFQDFNAKFGQKVSTIERRLDAAGIPNPDKH